MIEVGIDVGIDDGFIGSEDVGREEEKV